MTARRSVLWPRMRSVWPLLVSVLLSTLIASSLVAAFAGFEASALPQAVSNELATSGQRSVSISGAIDAEQYRADRGVVSSAIRRAFGGVPVTADDAVWSDPIGLPAPRGSKTVPLAQAAVMTRLKSQVRLVSGSWPAASARHAALQVAVPASVAAILRLKVGEVLALRDRLTSASVRFQVTGLYRPLDQSAPYWDLDLISPTGVSAAPGFVTYGPFIVDDSAFSDHRLAVGDATWLYGLATTHITADQLKPLSSRLTAAMAFLSKSADLGGLQVVAGLPGALQTVTAKLIVARSLLLVGELELLLLAGAALTLTARTLASQREEESATLRSRGAGRGQLVKLAVIEALIVTVTAAGAGALLSSRLTSLLAGNGPLRAAGIKVSGVPADAWWTAGLVLLLCTVIMIWPAMRPVSPSVLRVGRGRRSPALLLATAGADVALIALALLAGWQLREFSVLGRTPAGLGIDPVLALAPAIALAAGTVLPLRLLPLLARAGDKLAARTRRLGSALATWELSRRAVRQSAPMLLVVLAVGTSTLALAQHQSWRQSALDQSAFIAGADVRADTLFPATAGTAGAIAHAPGVTAAMAVSNAIEAPGNGELLAVGSGQAPAAVLLRGDQAAPSIFSRIRPAGSRSLITLPGHPTALAITADLNPGTGASLGRVRVTISIMDAGGDVYSIQAGTLPPDGRGHVLAARLTSTGKAIYPLRLVAITAGYTVPPLPRVPAPSSGARVATFAVTGLASSRPGGPVRRLDARALLSKWVPAVSAPGFADGGVGSRPQISRRPERRPGSGALQPGRRPDRGVHRQRPDRVDRRSGDAARPAQGHARACHRHRLVPARQPAQNRRCHPGRGRPGDAHGQGGRRGQLLSHRHGQGRRAHRRPEHCPGGASRPGPEPGPRERVVAGYRVRPGARRPPARHDHHQPGQARGHRARRPDVRDTAAGDPGDGDSGGAAGDTRVFRQRGRERAGTANAVRAARGARHRRARSGAPALPGSAQPQRAGGADRVPARHRARAPAGAVSHADGDGGRAGGARAREGPGRPRAGHRLRRERDPRARRGGERVFPAGPGGSASRGGGGMSARNVVRRVRDGLVVVTGTGAGASAVLAALVLASVFVATATPRASLAFRTRALQKIVSATPVAGRSVIATLDMPTLAEATGQNGLPLSTGMNRTVLGPIGSELGSHLRAAGLPLAPGGSWWGVATNFLYAPGAARSAYNGQAPPQVELIDRSGLPKYVRFIAGRMPALHSFNQAVGRFEVAVTAATAARFSLRVGSVLPVTDSESGAVSKVLLKVTGIFRPRQPGSSFWAADPVAVRPSLNKPSPASAGNWLASALISDTEMNDLELALSIQNMSVTWEFPLDLGHVNADQAAPLETELVSKLTALGLVRHSVPTALSVPLTAPISGTLIEFVQTEGQIGTLLSLLYVSLTVVGLVVLLLGGRLLGERRAGEFGLIRARGAGRWQLALVAARAGAVAVLPATIIAIGLGVLVTPGQDEPLAWWLAGITCAVALAGVPWLALRHARLAAERADSSPPRRVRLRRVVVDITAALAAAAGLLILRLQGQPAGGGTDWFTSAAPVLVAIPMAIIVVRVYPAVLRWLVALAGRRQGVTAFIGLARATRASASAILPAFALVLALAVIAFGAMLRTAVVAGDVAQSWRAVGADVVIDASGSNAPLTAAAERAIARVPGVQAATAVAVTSGTTADGTTVGVVAVDPAGYAALLALTPARPFPAGLARPAAGGSLPALASSGAATALRHGRGVLIGTRTVQVSIAGNIAGAPGVPQSGPFIVVPDQAADRILGGDRPVPNVVLIIGQADRARLRAVVTRLLPGATTITYRSAVIDALTGADLQRGAYVTFAQSAVAAAVFGALIMLIMLALGARPRELTLARLFTMGLSARQARFLVSMEALPAIAAATAGGAICAWALVPLLAPSIDLSLFTGSSARVPVQADFAVIGYLAAGLIAVALITLFAQGLAIRIRGVSRALRVGE